MSSRGSLVMPFVRMGASRSHFQEAQLLVVSILCSQPITSPLFLGRRSWFFLATNVMYRRIARKVITRWRTTPCCPKFLSLRKMFFAFGQKTPTRKVLLKPTKRVLEKSFNLFRESSRDLISPFLV